MAVFGSTEKKNRNLTFFLLLRQRPLYKMLEIWKIVIFSLPLSLFSHPLLCQISLEFFLCRLFLLLPFCVFFFRYFRLAPFSDFLVKTWWRTLFEEFMQYLDYSTWYNLEHVNLGWILLFKTRKTFSIVYKSFVW